MPGESPPMVTWWQKSDEASTCVNAVSWGILFVGLPVSEEDFSCLAWDDPVGFSLFPVFDAVGRSIKLDEPCPEDDGGIGDLTNFHTISEGECVAWEGGGEQEKNGSPCNPGCSFSQNVIGNHHAVIGLLGHDCSAADWLELAGCVDVIDAEDGKAAVEGIAPAAACLGEGVVKITDQLAVDNVSCAGVEIPTQNRGGGGEAAGLLQNLEDNGELLFSNVPVFAMGSARVGAPQAHIRRGCGQVNIDDLDLTAIGQAQCYLLIAHRRIADLSADLEASRDPCCHVCPEIAVSAVERV